MNRYMRMRRYNNGDWETMFPQAVTDNILRRENGGVLENYLVKYDNHIVDNLRHFNSAVTTNIHHPNLTSHRYLDVNIEDARLTDGFPLLLTLHCKVDAEPMISFNDGEYYPIVSASGNRIPGGQVAGSTILLVWSERMQAWILLSVSDTNDITKIAIPRYSEYTYVAEHDGESTFVVPGFDKRDCALEINYGQTVLRANSDYYFPIGSLNTVQLRNFTIEAGDQMFFKITSYEIVARSSATTFDVLTDDIEIIAEEHDQHVIPLPPEVQQANVMEFNYVQTVLRNGLDYDISEDKASIILKEFGLEPGEVLLAHIITLKEHDATTLPRQWNVPGAYSYEIKVEHGSFTATQDSTNIIPIPGFEQTRDEIVVIKDNKVLVYDVDYEIDRLNQVVLQDILALNTGDVLYYTLFKGAVQDVPPFIVVPEVSDDGKHLVLDFSYDLLRNGFVAVIRLRHTLVLSPTIKCLDGPAEPVLDNFGEPITGDYIPGSYLWVVYNEDQRVWYSMSHGHHDVSDNYGAFEFIEGDANFIGNDVSYADLGPDHVGEMVIHHGLHVKPTDIEIHPNEHPGYINNPYAAPSGVLIPGASGDQVRWMQWILWQLKYVNPGIKLNDWVTGIFDDRTLDSLHRWQKANNLEVKDSLDLEARDLMYAQGNRIQCIIGDVWASADEENIYVGNSGNATSSFHWIASTSAGQINFKESLNKVIDRLIELIKTRTFNFTTWNYDYVAEADHITIIDVPGIQPNAEKVLVANYGQTMLREGIDYNVTPTGIELLTFDLSMGRVMHLVIIRAGERFSTRTFTYRCTQNDTTDIQVNNYDPDKEIIFTVNYGQTLLRKNIDYTLTPYGIHLERLRLPMDTIVQFVLMKQDTAEEYDIF